MDEFLLVIFKATKFYETSLFAVPITYFTVLGFLATAKGFASQKKDFVANLSLYESDRILYLRFLEEGFEDRVIKLDYIILTIVFLFSWFISFWASYVYNINPPNIPIRIDSMTIISLSELLYFSLIILSVFEFFYLFKLKLIFTYQSIVDQFR